MDLGGARLGCVIKLGLSEYVFGDHFGFVYAFALEECGLNPRSWGASTPMKMCIQAVLDDTGALRHMNKNNSKRPVCITHPLTPLSTSFLFVFDTEWVMSTCEH